MALYLFVLLLMIALIQSRPAYAVNMSALIQAKADMRANSYDGFVILLNLLETTPYRFQRSEKLTFLMLDDPTLSAASLTHNNLEDFILRHTIPSGLSQVELMQLPNGTLVPSGIPKRMIKIINSKRTGPLMNNARIVTPNVCLGSVVQCHGISTEIMFGDSMTSFSASHSLSHRNKGSRMRK